MNNQDSLAVPLGNVHTNQSLSQHMFNKVPEITIFFWIIKVLCTTVGETAADFLNVNLNFGLTVTSIVAGVLLVIALFFQFKSKKYIPSIYWLAVVLISVFGTLVTDNLTDSLGVPLETSTIFFSIALALIFGFWYAKEKTLSIHAIYTGQRELFYWLAILCTFALGTASGDLMAEGLGLGYLLTGTIVAATVAIFAGAWRLGLSPVLSFWLIYIMTRPLGASLGDFLSQSQNHGGLGWGATITSVVFLSAILGVVVYLSVSKKDVIKKGIEVRASSSESVFIQTAITLSVLLAVAGSGYFWRQSILQGTVKGIDIEKTAAAPANVIIEPIGSVTIKDAKNTTSTIVPGKVPVVKTPVIVETTEVQTPVVQQSSLGDLSIFKTITQDTLNLVSAGKPADAKERIGDLEYEWDNAEAKLKRMDSVKWTEIDDAIDASLRQVRAIKPDLSKSESALTILLGAI